MGPADSGVEIPDFLSKMKKLPQKNVKKMAKILDLKGNFVYLHSYSIVRSLAQNHEKAIHPPMELSVVLSTFNWQSPPGSARFSL